MSTPGDMVAQDQKQTALLHAYRDIFEHHPAGRMVLADLLREAGVLSIVFDADAHRTAWNDGRRGLALFILERLRWSETELIALAMANDEPAFNAIRPDAGTTQVDDDEEVF